MSASDHSAASWRSAWRPDSRAGPDVIGVIVDRHRVAEGLGVGVRPRPSMELMQADRPPGDALSTPRAAGVVGVISALLLATVILLFREAVPAESTDPTVWFADSSKRDELQAAVRLLPFGGIFFLWFMGAVRAY
ncbi:hypothetical protein AB4Z54_15520, partial [Streptomyces sp. MCAF7]